MPDPLVIEVMRQFAADIAARESVQVAALVRAWLHIEDKLEADLNALASDMAAERAAGRVVSQAKLARYARYQALLGQLREEVASFGAFAVDSITEQQLTLAGLGLEQAAEAIALQLPTAGVAFDRLPISAVRNMVGLAGDGSPLKKLLANAYPDAVEGMTNALIRGTALGWHPTKTARAMRDGTEMGLQRSLTIARTEQLRVYRASSDVQFAASRVVRAKRRLAAKSERTCLACLVRDGEVIPPNEPAFDHVNGRCSFVPVLIGVDVPKWQSGRQWFESLSEATQREMMGKGHFEAWRDGAITLDDLVKITHDPTWGKSLGIRPLKEMAA